MTAAGRVQLQRRSTRCAGCKLSAFPADLRLGLDGFLSPQATRLACLAAASWSFDLASDRLDQIAGIRIDDETIRRHCHKAAAQVLRRRDSQPPAAAFQAAEGEVELLTDGVFAPSRNGWVEVKLLRLQKRVRGEAAEVADWANRELPAPSVSVCYATTGDSQEFSGRWQGWAGGLGIGPTDPLTIVGDGAAWIWRAATEGFPAAEQLLDIF